MSIAITQLQPAGLWHVFSQLCAIPRPSKHEQQVSLWIQNYAKELGLTVIEDRVGNLIIRKPATPGMENRKAVILQAHMDMVPQKNNDKVHDFRTDPIEAYIDGDWVTANGTTLGADNGIGLAASLAVLAAPTVVHGPLEVLVTIDEEAGMTGAFGLEPGLLQGEILLNTDSEQEGEVYMGCAGGIDVNIELPLHWQAPATDCVALDIVLKGLKGGHSGCDIHLGKANANKVLARIAQQLSAAGIALQLSHWQGGTLRNAIPREGQLQVVVDKTAEAQLLQLLSQAQTELSNEYRLREPNFNLNWQTIALPEKVLSRSQSQQLFAAVDATVNGVMRMSDELPSVVETSTNLGIIKIDGEQIKVRCLVRSLVDSARQATAQSIASVYSLLGANISFTGAYPGWQPSNESAAMNVVRESYQQLFGALPNIMVIHAGLECGLFKHAYPQWDMVSFGPTIKFPHSPDEKVEIATVARFWQLLTTVLANIPFR